MEKHIYVSDKFSGPDKDVSINMSQLKELTDAINIIKPTLGNQKKINKKNYQFVNGLLTFCIIKRFKCWGNLKRYDLVKDQVQEYLLIKCTT